MKPELLAKAGTEHSHQMALFQQANFHLDKYPELKWMHAIPNGGGRTPSQAAALKAEGVKPGISDVCLPVARTIYHGLYIEMKKPGGKESKEQVEFGAFLTSQGYFYRCCDHWEKAWDTIVMYMESAL